MSKPAFLLEDFLPYRLSVAANRVSRLFASRYGREFGLTIPEWRVMAVLGRFGPLPAREIAARTAMDKVKVSRAVALLLDRRLVLRRADRADARLQWLDLSAAGARMHAAIVPMARALEDELLAGLDAAEVAVLRRALGVIGERLAGEGEGID
ncbi:MarR family winged helix-turn-helix transcriptional regulator [Roseococcus sp. YIM B11640]|uniref:MarR family winged helix-turn-helix transcriptional regulator n=1 Tax=Roseococcus sp. YIM B11640 TaxID=3133973 RepID=UPI003C7D78FE